MAHLNPTHPLAVALEANRARYNDLFVSTRLERRALDPEDFMSFLVEGVAPAVEAAAAFDDDAAPRVADALYPVALELVARGLAGPGARYPVIDQLFSEVLTRLGRLLIERPARLATALAHAAINLDNLSAVDTRRWLDTLTLLAPRARDVGALLDAGKVLAWQLGAAHWRDSALATLATLPDELVRPALRLPDSDPRSRDELLAALADPWADLHSPRAPGFEQRGWVGGFSGFGGVFSTPPNVMALGGVIYAFDSESCYAVFADAYGSALLPFGNELPDVDTEDVPDDPITIDSGVARRGGDAARMVGLAQVTSTAQVRDTLAVTVAHSHSVMLVVHRGAP